MLTGITPSNTHLIMMLTWVVTYSQLAVWLDGRFAYNAGLCVVTFLGAAMRPAWTLPLMSLDNLLFTVVVGLMWAAAVKDLAVVRAVRGGKRSWLVERDVARLPPAVK